MPDAHWKRREREAAELFGGTRNPLSGENSQHTGCDVIHDDLYIEVKTHKVITIWDDFKDLRKKAHRLDRKPLMVLHAKGSKDPYDWMFVVDAEDAAQAYSNVKHGQENRHYAATNTSQLVKNYLVHHEPHQRPPFGSLWETTKEAAYKEGKTPIILAAQKNCHGFLAVVPVHFLGS